MKTITKKMIVYKYKNRTMSLAWLVFFISIMFAALGVYFEALGYDESGYELALISGCFAVISLIVLMIMNVILNRKIMNNIEIFIDTIIEDVVQINPLSKHRKLEWNAHFEKAGMLSIPSEGCKIGDSCFLVSVNGSNNSSVDRWVQVYNCNKYVLDDELKDCVKSFYGEPFKNEHSISILMTKRSN